MRQIISNLLRKQAGTKKMQRIYEKMFRVALAGMNYGNGQFFKNSGELNILKIIRERFLAEKLITIFDVGGNVGNYSRHLADFFLDKAIIHAFEPSKKTFEIFCKTTSGLTTIVPNNFGMSDTESELVLYSDEEASGLASIYHRNLEHFGISMNNREIISLSTIDNYCHQKNIDRIHFLKLDVEGHELAALKGARHMINTKKIDCIQFEFGGCNIDSRTYFQDFFYLLKDNYRIYRILKDGLMEISSYKETNEVFVTVNYFAIRLED